ncbi:MAG: hypothetical protein JXQ29_17255 [Planctomycetes bacterium]|nr:hypothetical protein [Planctomycetota bacterium]
MDSTNDAALAAFRRSAAQALRPVARQEWSGAPSGPACAPVCPALKARLEHAARRATRGNPKRRWVDWIQEQPLAALGQVAIATAVGTALVVHHRIQLAWWLPLLALLGLGLLLVGGRMLLTVVAQALAAAGHGGASSEEAAAALPPSRLDVHIIAVLLSLSAACFMPLVLASGWPLVAAGITAAVLAALLLNRFVPRVVQGPAQSLVRLGLGVSAVSVVVLAHTGVFSADTCVAGLQLGLLACLPGVIDNMQHLARDRASGRRTLVSSWGVPAGRVQIALMCLVPCSMSICWALAGAWGAALLPLLSLPLAFWLIRDVNLYFPGPIFRRFRPRAIALHLTFAVLLATGLLI